MRMSVLEIMEIDRAVNVLKTHEKTDRRLLVDPFEGAENADKLTIESNTQKPVNSDIANHITDPCRDCPEGMEW
jgi:hypothetical protein